MSQPMVPMSEKEAARRLRRGGDEGNGSGSMGKKKGRRAPILVGGVILCVLLAAGAVFGSIWLVNTITFVSTDDAAIDANHVSISSKMLGRIAAINVEEGSKVEAGQVLVTLEDKDLRAQETQATASLAYARQNLALAKINQDKTAEDARRVQALYASGAATKEQNDHAVSALDTANAQYAIAQAQVDTSNAQLGVIESQLLNTRITTPISGFVARKSYMPGDVIQPGQAILTINDLDNVWVTANFEETKISRIRVGAQVEITVDAFGGRVFTGKVALIGAGILTPPFSIGDFTKTTQRIPVKIVFSPAPESLALLPGMSAEVKVRIR